MDYNKIGNFIVTERKAKNLTQAKLAEKLFVSEKTISKWENGKGLPDTNVLPKLCEIFNVTLNEILSGKRIKGDQKKEEVILHMAEELEQKNKVIWTSMWVIITVSMIALVGGGCVSSYLIPKGIWQVLSIIGICILFLIPLFYALKLEVCVGVYKCKKCGVEILPTYTEALNTMHIGTTRYLKCPNCHKRTWCKKVIK